MRLLLARKPTAASVGRWRLASPTASPQDVRGRHDSYEAVVTVRKGEEPRQAFARIRDRLLRYDVFPRALMTHSIEPGQTVEPGALIVQSVGVGSLRLEFAVRVVRCMGS